MAKTLKKPKKVSQKVLLFRRVKEKSKQIQELYRNNRYINLQPFLNTVPLNEYDLLLSRKIIGRILSAIENRRHNQYTKERIRLRYRDFNGIDEVYPVFDRTSSKMNVIQ